MATKVRRINYYYATVQGEPGDAYELLAQLANLGVNLLALTVVPTGPTSTQLTLFPEDRLKLTSAAEKARLPLNGPHPAILVQGDDELGALAGIHTKLHEADVSVFASSGVTDGRGGYGYVVYLRPEEAERAERALEL
jgi:hypothetical protein